MYKHTIKTLLSLVIATCLLMSSGCDKQEQCSCESISANDSSTCTKNTSYNCASLDDNDPLKQSWCDAQAFFEQKSHLDTDSKAFKDYLNGYRHGMNDASQGKASRISRSQPLQGSNFEDNGYRNGYEKVMTQLGLIEINAEDTNLRSQYRERYYEIEKLYHHVEQTEDDNPFQKSRYIDGYMKGGYIALTLPAPMNPFMDNEELAGKQLPPIAIPEEPLSDAQRAFYRGFEEGYKAMMANIRNSINQIMEQMQQPNN
ncbi:MAG: hypothetical protein PUP46_01415 [Endozoicomonas sp. (ex Botrylloides leachii)]|nr:hypothetical protein [Endozoicomonas sp. (ex Botrylloides leachii)]